MNKRFSVMDAAMLRTFLLGGCNYLGAHKEDVNALNVFPVPDGDTGINMYLSVSSAAQKINGGQSSSVGQIAADFSRGTLMGARGNSGVILSQIFRGFALSLQNKKTATPKELAAALQKGVDLSYKSVMKPVEGTILTVYRATAAAAEKAAASGADLAQMLSEALSAGEQSLASTPELLPVLKEAGVVDAGGKGLLVFMQGGIMAVRDGGEVALEDHSAVSVQTEVVAAARNDISTANIEFKFCTQLLIKGENLPIDAIRAHLSQDPPGDSLLVVGDDTVVKLHFHNNRPWQVMEYCARFGELHDIIIDNMCDQHHENYIAQDQATASKSAGPAIVPAPKEAIGLCSVIAVAAGDGMVQAFHDLGATVLCGGQTMNPSAEDLLRAIDLSGADQVVILPNNSNIILAAQQVQKLTKKKVCIVPTKFVTEGLSAMLSFNCEQGADDNAVAMQESAHATVNGELTYAVRDTKFNGFDIKQNDLLALTQGTISGCGQDMEKVLSELLDHMLEMKNDVEIISLYYGDNISKDDAQKLADTISERYPDLELELHSGGQPLYYFLLAVE